MLYKRALYFGLFSIPIGLLVGTYIQLTTIGAYSGFAFFATFSTFSASFLAWLFIVEKPAKYSSKRGALAGMIAILFAHYLTWYSILIVSNIQYWVFGLQVNSLNEPPVNLIVGLFAMLLPTFISYLVAGWITIPYGAIIGWFFNRKYQNAKTL